MKICREFKFSAPVVERKFLLVFQQCNSRRTCVFHSQDSSVGIVFRLRFEWSVVRFPAAITDFYFIRNIPTGFETNPPSQSRFTFGTFPGVRRTERKVDHLLPSTAYVKDEWSFSLILLYVFIAWTCTWHRFSSQFIVYFTRRPMCVYDISLNFS
jgi:hypothetical protein